MQAYTDLADLGLSDIAHHSWYMVVQIDLPGTTFRKAKEAKQRLLDIIQPNVEAAIAALEAGEWSSIKRRSTMQVRLAGCSIKCLPAHSSACPSVHLSLILLSNVAAIVAMRASAACIRLLEGC